MITVGTRLLETEPRFDRMILDTQGHRRALGRQRRELRRTSTLEAIPCAPHRGPNVSYRVAGFTPLWF